MLWKQLFAKKSLEMLHAEAMGDNRLRRVLGPVALTSLGIGAIIGAGIFVMTGRVAAQDAGPAVVVSFMVAGVACALAAFCYAEFASLAPVAGSAYTYAYATLGELLAWIIGWDLILEYAMSAATVAAVWSKYLNEFLLNCFGENWVIPEYLCHDPFSGEGYINLPAVVILAVVTTILVIGIRESAASNTALVVLKLGVVLFVIAVGAFYINPDNWTTIPPDERRQPEELLIPGIVKERHPDDKTAARKITEEAIAAFKLQRAEASGDPARIERVKRHLGKILDRIEPASRPEIDAVLAQAKEEAPRKAAQEEARKWGMFGLMGLNRSLVAVDNNVRSSVFPFGLSGMMLGAALVFFAFIGFDSISTHAEEAVRPQRDVPIGILASLFSCTLLYVLVSGIITGMEPYPYINPDAAVASAFRMRAEHEGGNAILRASAGLIAAGALAGMTSVLLITFLSQARIFLAMARDNLLPHNIFGVVHPRFRTPHISTMLTGGLMCLVAAFTPIYVLEEMVNIGTLFAFVVVCAAVLILRIRRPDAPRPFRCPALFLVAPLGILVNLVLMLFLPVDTWLRLVIWMGIGLVIYFTFGLRYSALGQQLRGGTPTVVHGSASEEIKPAGSP